MKIKILSFDPLELQMPIQDITGEVVLELPKVHVTVLDLGWIEKGLNYGGDVNPEIKIDFKDDVVTYQEFIEFIEKCKDEFIQIREVYEREYNKAFKK